MIESNAPVSNSIKIKNIRIVYLKGTRTERARAHGELIAGLTESEKAGLVYTPLSQKNQTLIKRAGKRVPGLGNLIGGLYEAFVLERFLRLPKFYRSRLTPFAKASNISLKKVWLSLYQPDMLMVLAATARDKIRNRFLQGMPGCSTTTVSHQGELHFLRNLDYPAASYWEKNSTVFYHEPTEEGLQNYVSISSLGIDTAGLTGFNDSGIAFSLHAHFSKNVSLKGTPIFFLGEEILENARNLEEAIELCRRFKPIGSWALNITSFKEKTAATVELVKGKVFVRMQAPECGIAHSNSFQSEEFKKDELHFSGAFFEDCESRKITLERAMRELSENFTWQKGLSALASHVDPTTGKTRIFGNTVSVVTTIQCMGFDPKEKCFYISTRDETPTPLGPFLKLPFQFKDLKIDDPAVILELPHSHSPEFMSALHFYYQAYVSWQVRSEDAEHAHSFLIQATDALGTDPHLQMQRGYFELIAGQYLVARNCFETALTLELSTHTRHVAQYFRGCALDMLGDRDQARVDFQAILASPRVDEKLGEKAKKRLNSPYCEAYCKRIEPDLQFVEPIDYV